MAKRKTSPTEPTPESLMQEFINSLVQEASDELGIKSPADLARVMERFDSILMDLAMRGKELDEASVKWLKRQTGTALGSAEVRNLGRAARAQTGAATVISGVIKVALAAMIAQITPGTRLAPPSA